MHSKKILSSIPNSIRTIRRLAAGSLNKDITFQQFRVLNLTFEGQGQTQMSQTLQVSMAAISKMVDPLVKRGLLERGEDIDRRCSKLKLSVKGAKARKLVTKQVEKTLDKNFAKLTKKEQSDLKKGLDVLDKLMGYINEK
jgi:DNA-binding MarR family transcriptional regulator